ncbi:unnamed protein product [Callosobruchus maculatus]|uniref:Uncharacterized protein n=1 Tax=Callosobruchus maculatus TaxID=64391 RepID=A0A653DW66_CALMS|nr:unnamed protein product [Callosobruchus maculatus]
MFKCLIAVAASTGYTITSYTGMFYHNMLLHLIGNDSFKTALGTLVDFATN